MNLKEIQLNPTKWNNTLYTTYVSLVNDSSLDILGSKYDRAQRKTGLPVLLCVGPKNIPNRFYSLARSFIYCYCIV